MSTSLVGLLCILIGHKWVKKPNHDWYICKRCGEVKNK